MSALPRSIRRQQDRRAELFALRRAGRITPSESNELDRLDDALYMRQWRAQLRAETRAAMIAGNAPAAKAAEQSPAVAEIAALRREQVVRFGHTPQADNARDPQDFARLLRTIAKDIHEDVQFGQHGLARRHAIKLGALAAAFADKLQREADCG